MTLSDSFQTTLGSARRIRHASLVLHYVRLISLFLSIPHWTTVGDFECRGRCQTTVFAN